VLHFAELSVVREPLSWKVPFVSFRKSLSAFIHQPTHHHQPPPIPAAANRRASILDAVRFLAPSLKDFLL
jgi:hypothetical protein